MTTPASQPDSWASSYVGLPYRLGGRDAHGVDCWGLMRMVFARELGVQLPDVPGYDDGHPLAVTRLLTSHAEMGAWQPEAACDARDYDGVLLAKRRAPAHVGIVVGHGLRHAVLHAVMGQGVILTPHQRLPVHGWRPLCYYRRLPCAS